MILGAANRKPRGNYPGALCCGSCSACQRGLSMAAATALGHLGGIQQFS